MITEFKGEYSWLSNFSPVNITFPDGSKFISVEHAYMSAKSRDPKWKKFCLNPNNTAAKVKKASKDVELRDNWEDVKLKVMGFCIKEKFNQEPFKSLLIATGDEDIQEGNYWNDKYWGVCLKSEEGENHLGKLIMKIRNEIKTNK